MDILIADKFEPAGIEALRALGCQVTYEPGAGAEGLAQALARVRPDVLIVRSARVPAPVIQAAEGLKAIIRAGAGVDNIDVAAAKARGVGVANCPGMNSIAVAELTMGLILACDRRIAEQTAEIKSGRWNKKEFSTKSKGLKGSTLLIVGLGAIGRAVAQRARAFEMRVIGWDALLGPDAAAQAGIEWAGSDRAALLRALSAADIATIHVALVPQTRQFCNDEFFAALKPGAYFINTSRGGVVDEAALIAAARTRNLRVGLDVYEGQPGTPQGEFSSAVTAIPGSAFTHHCGASTEQAQQAVGDETIRLVKALMQSGRLENAVA